MIIEQEKSNITTNISKSSSFKIQASSKAFEILSSNIYKNKIRAVIREISCNAVDAHISAGVDKPFDVHLPTYLEKWFSVRDYGLGIPEENMEEIYTTYFYSDKTETNDLIGGLGLGTKSPLSLVDSFTVVNYNNGYKLEYCCFKNENKEPQITLLSKVPSNEPTGIEVKLSTKDFLIMDFETNAVQVYKFFDSMPNINNQKIKERIEEEKTSIKWIDCFAANKENKMYIIMGNVCYEVPDVISAYNLKYGVYIRADIGEVNFDPGREYVTLDKKTKEYLRKKVVDILASLESIARADLDSIKCPFERAKAYVQKYKNLQISKLHKDYIQTIPSYKLHAKRYDRYESYSRNELDYSEKTAYCYSPRGKTLSHKVKHLLNNGYNLVCMLDAKTPIDYVPAALLIDLDAYKMPVTPGSISRASNRPNLMGKAFKVDVSTIDQYFDSSKLPKHDVVEMSTVPEEERYVIPFYSRHISGFNSFRHMYLVIQEAQKNNSEVPQVIYFVHSVTYKSKKFQKFAHKNVSSVIKEEFKHLKDNKYYEDSLTNVQYLLQNVNKLGSSCKVIENAQKKLDNFVKDYKMSLIADFVGVQKRGSIIEEVNEDLYVKHPIFKLVDLTSCDSSEINVLRSYV